jgi:hypothetical protein
VHCERGKVRDTSEPGKIKKKRSEVIDGMKKEIWFALDVHWSQNS